MIEITRNLRKKQTESEKIFWDVVRNRKLGIKFVRQFALCFTYQGQSRFFIADFFCHEKKLVVEIDGGVHEEQKDYDDLRTYIINQLNIKVVRFKNEELYDIERIKNILKNLL
ncbi:MAG: endonuclease domain-containing protein [Ignavibacteriales bacterium]